ncbi:MAG: hypothetical protein HC913_10285, partial [Microscillaceae bacterium]|nr:hypothetical protein [Microscillaceae bacterium]
MNRSSLIFPHSPWLILVCLLIGLGYAFLLYQKKSPWSLSLNYVLAFLRFGGGLHLVIFAFAQSF